jgi:hypothetical protein
MKDWEVAKVMHIVDIVPVPFFPVKLFCSSTPLGRTCTPLRWRLDCQLVGRSSSTQFGQDRAG